MKPWVLMDVSYLAYRAHYANPDLAWEDLHTEVLFGFWEQLRIICEDEFINSNRVVACFDSRQSIRREQFPEYKIKREDITPEEREMRRTIHDQLQLLRREILPNVGIQVLHQTGLESDDVMAQAARQLTDAEEEAILVTADGDLWQCITHFVSWYDPARKTMYSPTSFEAKKGILPRWWGTVKSLAGCSGDGVPGIEKVGEKTAVKFLLGTLPSHHKTFQAIQSPEGRAIIERNKQLVGLPHQATKPVPLRSPEYSTEEFFAMCRRYGFLSYLKEPKRREWEKFLQLKRKIRTRRRGEKR